MAYIGIDPNVGDITFQKFTGTGSATAFTLAQSVVSGEAIVVTIGNVVQEPGVSAAYTAQANTLTFSAAPANGDIITVRYFGRAVDQPTSYAMQLFKYVATASQTAFTGADANGAILAISGNDVDVYLNGVHLDSSDFAASGGDTITLTTGAALNDELVIRAYRAFSVTDTVSKSSGGTFAGGVSFSQPLKVSEIQDPTNGNTAMTVDTSGIVTIPKVPAFYVKKSGKQTDIAVNSAVTVTFESVISDQGNNFASNTFTAPVSGFYHFSAYLRLENIDSAAGYYLFMFQISGTQIQGHLFDPDFGQDNSFFAMNSSLTYYLTAGQTVFIQIQQSGGTAQTDIDSDSWFSGHLVG